MNNINEFTPDYYVYTDGACKNNGKRNAIASTGIFFGINDPRNISSKITGKQTNNTAELTAILNTFPLIENDINNGKKIYSSQDNYVYNQSKDYYSKHYDYEENYYDNGKVQQDYHKKEEIPNSEYSRRGEDAKSKNNSENREVSNKNYKIDLVFNDKKDGSKSLFIF